MAGRVGCDGTIGSGTLRNVASTIHYDLAAFPARLAIRNSGARQEPHLGQSRYVPTTTGRILFVMHLGRSQAVISTGK